MSDRINELAAELQKTRRTLAEAEDRILSATTAQINAINRVSVFLAEHGGDQVLEQWLAANTALDQATDAIAPLKKAEKAASEALAGAVESAALADWIAQKDVFGRKHHAHVEVIRKFSLQLPENPYELGAFVAELAQKGKRDLIEVKVHGNTDFFRDTTFTSPVTKLEIPQARVDSAKTWPLSDES